MENFVDIGVIGLAVMGQNIVLNIADSGFSVSVYNRTASKVEELLQKKSDKHNIIPTSSIKEFVLSIKRPRKILLMVKAGNVVDGIIDQILPLLDKGDIIIDGGNSYYKDTEKRYDALLSKGIMFVGAGISGGEQGARYGAAITVGGDIEAWDNIKPIFQSIAARSDDNSICCDRVGPGGAGHYVKMVHNGIEYADMQLIAESYDIIKNVLHYNPIQLSDVYDRWNKGKLNSYLIEITSLIFKKKEGEDFLIDKILDVAGQKGTGRWMVEEALDINVPIPSVAQAVFARNLSAMKDERIEASNNIEGPKKIFDGKDENHFIEEIERAVYASKIICYTQGFMLMDRASHLYGWELDLGNIALLWRGGCIIRSAFLKDIYNAYSNNKSLQNLLLDDFFSKEIVAISTSWRTVVATSAMIGVFLPCISSCLSFFDGYRSDSISANLIQAQRDFFGAHTYERIDRNRGEFFHSIWSD
jgi:6-phosphogluconate dehydrogenase